MDEATAEHEVRLVPPFPKGGLGGISGCHDSATIKQNPPRPPLGKGGDSFATGSSMAGREVADLNTLTSIPISG